MKYKLLILLVFIILSSCSYRLERIQDVNGKKYWVRYYPDLAKEEKYNIRGIFRNRNNSQNYKRYSNSIIFDSIEEYKFIQYDSIRIYLEGNSKKYFNIFSSGLISGQMIFCELNNTCTEPKGHIMTDSKTGQVIERNFLGWKKGLIRINEIEELKYFKLKPSTKRYKLRVYTDIGIDIMFLELLNDSATDRTNLEDFIKGARTTFLNAGCSEI